MSPSPLKCQVKITQDWVRNKHSIFDSSQLFDNISLNKLTWLQASNTQFWQIMYINVSLLKQYIQGNHWTNRTGLMFVTENNPTALVADQNQNPCLNLDHRDVHSGLWWFVCFQFGIWVRILPFPQKAAIGGCHFKTTRVNFTCSLH